MAEPTLERGFATLRRLTRQAKQTPALTKPEQCEFCGEAIPPAHRHLLDMATHTLLCVCQPCSILFDRESASQGKYRLIPERRRYLVDFCMTESQWASLCVPVEIVFLFYSTPAGKVVAFYPSPLGPTESLLGLDAWQTLTAQNPRLNEMAPDVEALLINRSAKAHQGAPQHFLVPIDDCYRLVALLRTQWRGLSGGSVVWQALGQFFAQLQDQAKPLRQADAG